MSAITFDTHAFIKRLTAVGMPESQAEVLAEEQAKLIENRLATKDDLDALRTALKADLREQSAELKLWSAGLAGVVIAALAALKLFGH